MKPRTLLRIAVCVGLAFATAGSLSAQTKKTAPPSVRGVQYQPLNVKPGLWQSTVTIKRSGGLPLSNEMLEKMTPDQRARLEARMNATSGNTNTTTDKQCITKEDLERPMDFSRNDCTWTITESTSTIARGSVSCQTQGIVLNGSGSYEAVDPEHMRGSQHMTTTGGGNTMVVDGTFTSTWVGACEKGR